MPPQTKEIRAWFLRLLGTTCTSLHAQSWLNQVERWFALLSQRQINEVPLTACVNWNLPS